MNAIRGLDKLQGLREQLPKVEPKPQQDPMERLVDSFLALWDACEKDKANLPTVRLKRLTERATRAVMNYKESRR